MAWKTIDAMNDKNLCQFALTEVFFRATINGYKIDVRPDINTSVCHVKAWRIRLALSR